MSGRLRGGDGYLIIRFNCCFFWGGVYVSSYAGYGPLQIYGF